VSRDIDVTPILDEDCGLLSASRAELGENAGQITWRNCIALAERLPLVTDENRDDIRDHFADYGAWEREEIDARTDTELSAMVWQEAAACVREFEDYCGADRKVYQRKCEEGTCSGRLSIEDEPRRAWFYVGS
jgi:hypothetical protein